MAQGAILNQDRAQASNVTFDNKGTSLTATNVQDAIEELDKSRIQIHGKLNKGVAWETISKGSFVESVDVLPYDIISTQQDISILHSFSDIAMNLFNFQKGTNNYIMLYSIYEKSGSGGYTKHQTLYYKILNLDKGCKIVKDATPMNISYQENSSFYFVGAPTFLQVDENVFVVFWKKANTYYAKAFKVSDNNLVFGPEFSFEEVTEERQESAAVLNKSQIVLCANSMEFYSFYLCNVDKNNLSITQVGNKYTHQFGKSANLYKILRKSDTEFVTIFNYNVLEYMWFAIEGNQIILKENRQFRFEPTGRYSNFLSPLKDIGFIVAPSGASNQSLYLFKFSDLKSGTRWEYSVKTASYGNMNNYDTIVKRGNFIETAPFTFEKYFYQNKTLTCFRIKFNNDYTAILEEGLSINKTLPEEISNTGANVVYGSYSIPIGNINNIFTTIGNVVAYVTLDKSQFIQNHKTAISGISSSASTKFELINYYIP